MLLRDAEKIRTEWVTNTDDHQRPAPGSETKRRHNSTTRKKLSAY